MLALVFNRSKPPAFVTPVVRLPPLLLCPLPPYRPRKPVPQSYDARTRVLTYAGVSYGNVSAAQFKQFQAAGSKESFIWMFLRGRRRT